MPSFTPAVCRLRIDLRISPRTTIEEAEAAFAEMLRSCSDELAIETSYQRIVAIPGARTDPKDLIIEQSIKSWEAISGNKHHAVTGMSGATDANILRGHGVSTARVGLPKAQIPNIDFQLGMNAVDIDDLYNLTALLTHIALSFQKNKN